MIHIFETSRHLTFISLLKKTEIMLLTTEELDLLSSQELFNFVTTKYQDQLNGSLEYEEYIFDESQDEVSIYVRITGCLSQQGFQYSRKVKLISEEPNSNII